MKKIILLLLLVVVLSLTSCDETEIHVPYSDYEYKTDGWEANDLVEHFKDLGFEDIEVIKESDPYYRHQVAKVSIGGDTDLYPKKTFFSSQKVKIYYYEESSTLTVENCPDLLNLLTAQEIDYMSFAKKYDGKYIEFDAYIDSINPYDKSIIEVAYGDYSSNEPTGNLIRIEEDSTNIYQKYDDTLKEGQNVKVIGKVNAYMSEYFKMVYIYTAHFQPR